MTPTCDDVNPQCTLARTSQRERPLKTPKELIDAIVEKHAITVAQIGKLMTPKVSRISVQYWRSGARKPSLEKYQQLAELADASKTAVRNRLTVSA